MMEVAKGEFARRSARSSLVRGIALSRASVSHDLTLRNRSETETNQTFKLPSAASYIKRLVRSDVSSVKPRQSVPRRSFVLAMSSATNWPSSQSSIVHSLGEINRDQHRILRQSHPQAQTYGGREDFVRAIDTDREGGPSLRTGHLTNGRTFDIPLADSVSHKHLGHTEFSIAVSFLMSINDFYSRFRLFATWSKQRAKIGPGLHWGS